MSENVIDISTCSLIENNQHQYKDIISNINDILYTLIIKLNDIINEINNKRFQEQKTINQLLDISSSLTKILKYNDEIKKQLNMNFIENKKKEIKKEKYPDGSSYEGEFCNGKREGKGTYYFINGNKYEGDFKDGKKEGKGIMYYKNGNKYEG